MKVLVLCNHGNVRSACMAREIKDLNGPCISTDERYLETFSRFQSVAIGAHCNNLETIKYFIDWADKVIDMSDEDINVQARLKNLAKDKYLRFNVGYDIWHNPFHPDLRVICQNKIKEVLI